MRYRRTAIAILMAFSTLCMAQQALNNDTIIKMHSAGLGDDILISTINSQPGMYLVSADDLVILKKAGISDKVIGTMISKNSGSSQPVVSTTNAGTPPTQNQATTSPTASQTLAPVVRQPDSSVPEPRVFLQAVSHGDTQNARRDQSMEMSKDFEKDCPGVKITILQQMADYTVVLNHIEIGAFVRDNQIQVANKDGDLISKTKEGGSIEGGVKKACTLILADWAKK